MSKIYDLEYLKDLASGDDNFLLSMIDDFIHQTPETIQQISDNIEKGDQKSIYAIVHRFIPTLQYMGATAIVDKFREIEKLAKGNSEIILIKSCFEQAKVDTFALLETIQKDFDKNP
jgi:HPt (histidine-containing phosphotransfer) domain-containing protein